MKDLPLNDSFQLSVLTPTYGYGLLHDKYPSMRQNFLTDGSDTIKPMDPEHYRQQALILESDALALDKDVKPSQHNAYAAAVEPATSVAPGRTADGRAHASTLPCTRCRSTDHRDNPTHGCTASPVACMKCGALNHHADDCRRDANIAKRAKLIAAQRLQKAAEAASTTYAAVVPAAASALAAVEGRHHQFW